MVKKWMMCGIAASNACNADESAGPAATKTVFALHLGANHVS